MPYLFQTEIRPTTDIGIICHYNDVSRLAGVDGTQSYRIIDIQAGFRAVIEEVLACEAVVSTSLHGLVLAEAYGRTGAWLQIDRGKRLAGGEFKFKDYLLATRREVVANRVQSGRPLQLRCIKWLPAPDIDLQPLLGAFPAIKGLTLDRLVSIPLEEL
jgi:hypothetical protein